MSLVRPTHAVLRDPGALSAYFAEHGYALPHPIALLFPRIMGLGQEALTESIRKAGIRDNITVFGDRIADGIARCESGITLGIPWKQIPKTEFVGDETALLQFVIEKNVNRRHLDESQRAMVAARLATMKQGARNDLARICAMSQPQAAERLNVSRRLVQDASNVLDHGVLELQDAVNDGILSVSAASKLTKLPGNQQRAIVVKSLAQPKPAKAFGAAIRNAAIQSRHRQIVADARLHDLAGKRYFILLADVPWDVPWDGFEPYAGSPYPLLSNEQVCQFRVDDGRFIREVAADNAIMFFWITDKHLFDVPPILQSWGGFQLRYTMAWPKPSIGIGQYARRQHELVLVCTRGNFRPPEEHLRPSTLIVGPALDSGDGFRFAPGHDSRHSSKPDQLYEKIEQMYPQYFGMETVASPFALELFARNYRPKWDGQGFEYPGHPENGEAGPKREDALRRATQFAPRSFDPALRPKTLLPKFKSAAFTQEPNEMPKVIAGEGAPTTI